MKSKDINLGLTQKDNRLSKYRFAPFYILSWIVSSPMNSLHRSQTLALGDWLQIIDKLVEARMAKKEEPLSAIEKVRIEIETVINGQAKISNLGTDQLSQNIATAIRLLRGHQHLRTKLNRLCQHRKILFSRRTILDTFIETRIEEGRLIASFIFPNDLDAKLLKMFQKMMILANLLDTWLDCKKDKKTFEIPDDPERTPLALKDIPALRKALWSAIKNIAIQ